MKTSLSTLSDSAVDVVAVSRCPLCDSAGTLSPLSFWQPYAQAGEEPAQLSWSACEDCGGWFANPMPTCEQIANHWTGMDYARAGANAEFIGDRKNALFTRLLESLSKRVSPGPLLDIGCNFGRFLTLAQKYGWQPCGFEPNPEAAKHCVDVGFDVRSGWDLQQCNFADGHFGAVTVIDAFCLSLYPFADLAAYYRLLRPGGVLAMRLTNKHAAIKLASRVMPSSQRDDTIARLLLGQFHSASPATVRYWLKKTGFTDVKVVGGAMSIPWREARWGARLAYGGSELLRILTLGTVTLSPGILVFAQKPE